MSQLLTPASLEDVLAPISTKKQTEFSKTQKNSSKINNLLKTLQEMEDDDTTGLGDFYPPPKPVSIGSQRTTDSKENSIDPPARNTEAKSITSGSSGLELNHLKYTYPEPSNVEAYYKKYIPAYACQKEGYTNVLPTPSESSQNTNIPNSVISQPPLVNKALLDKLNYMIHLLEDKQDIKSSSKLEEIGLYCLLGIFTIFLVDSFSRVGKYVR